MKKRRHLLAVKDLKPEEVHQLIHRARELKRDRKRAQGLLSGKTLGLLFEKPSLRTRLSFEIGMGELGGRSFYMGPAELQGGKREEAKDLAAVLSRYLDGMVVRTFGHSQLEELAQGARVSVINGLSDQHHPCQALSDLLTIEEKFGTLQGVQVAYVGDGNNVCHSLLEGCALLGMSLAVATPPRYRPAPAIVQWAVSQAKRSGGRILLSQDPLAAVRGAMILYTDVWTSMGQEKEKAVRKRAFRGFQVNQDLFRAADRGALFMHCLPAHRGEEVTDEVMDSHRSIVYDQAENRLHMQKAILLSLLGGT